jgi:phosphatidylserine decarboxylase
MVKQRSPIAIEGYPFIALFAFITLIFALLKWGIFAFPFLLLTLFTVYFFRDPERCIPEDEHAVVAPADGRIVFCGEVIDERYGPEPAFKVSIFMSVFNVHVNRSPCNGTIVNKFYNPGDFLNAALDKASHTNEQSGLLMQTSTGSKVLFIQIAGLIARRIITYPNVGDILERGERYGLIRFGSRVDVYLPQDTDVLVRLGDNVTAGETIVGYLK